MFGLPLGSIREVNVQTVSTCIRKAALRGRVYVYYLSKLQSLKASVSELANTESLLQGKEKKLTSQGALVTTFLSPGQYIPLFHVCFSKYAAE